MFGSDKETDNNMPEEPRKGSKKKKILIIILVAVAALIAAAATVFFVVASKYQDVFLNNTYIDGINVSGLTPEEVNDLVVKQQEDYLLTVTFRDGSEETITGDQFGYTYDALPSIKNILEEQVPSDWVKEYIGGDPEYDFESTVTRSYDTDQLKEAVAALPELQADAMTDPTNAYVALAEDTSFVIIPETEGNKMDVAVIQDAACDAVENYGHEINVEELGAYYEPEVRSDNQELIAKADELNGYLKAVITYNFTGYTLVIDRMRVINWLGKDENGNYYYDDNLWESGIVGFLDELAADLANEPNTWLFDATGVGTVTVTGGSYQRVLDREKEIERIREYLKEGANVTLEPILQAAGDASQNHGLGNTYVEIDISRQHLWAYDNGTLYLECDVVTGKPTEERYTPQGVYYVYYKKTDATLRGDQKDDGTYEYESFVSYWMPFNGGIGMHDASWRASFGGTEYISNGSHGCVNMPVDMAPLMYQWIESNVPVVVYYSEEQIWVSDTDT